jgi:hypothetical protein
VSGRGRARRLAERLSERDIAILESLWELRLMTGDQLGRRHFAGSQPVTRDRKMRRAMQRLANLKLVVRLRRRVGGVRAGSRGFAYGLSGLGQATLDVGQDSRRRHRRVIETKPAFQDHTLAVSELYVSLVERCHVGPVELGAFAAEPGCWRRFGGLAGQAVTLKPDAFVQLVSGSGAYEASAFVEMDLDTESLPTIMRKLGVYVAYWRTGAEQQRHGVFPKVWWLAPTAARREAIARTIERLPHEARVLFRVCLITEAADLLINCLPEEVPQ